MACTHPITRVNAVLPCGACRPCRKRLAWEWTVRQDLEATYQREKHGYGSSFVTLTYSDKCLPKEVTVSRRSGDTTYAHSEGTLNPEHAQLFLRTLRDRLRVHPDYRGVRFYVVGEYGDKTKRPHVHINIFTYAPDDEIGGMTFAKHVAEAWPHGFVKVLPYKLGASSYTSGYVIKGLYQAANKNLDGRHPEFRRSSLKPGIGVPAIQEFVQANGIVVEPGDTAPVTLETDYRSVRLRGHLLRKYRLAGGWRQASTPLPVTKARHRAEHFAGGLPPVEEARKGSYFLSRHGHARRSHCDFRAAGRAELYRQTSIMALQRQARIEEDHGPRELGANPNTLATASVIFHEIHAADTAASIARDLKREAESLHRRHF